jgi:hypothetical protein
MQYKSGTNKKGKAWAGHFCPSQVCEVVWDKPGKAPSSPQAAPTPAPSASTGPPTDIGVGRRIAALQAAAQVYQGTRAPADAVLSDADKFARWLGNPVPIHDPPIHPDDRGEM